jgi:hypothetical protein
VRKHGRKVAIVVRKAAARRPIKRKGKRMARKLHAKRMAKLHRKRNPHRRRRKRRNPGVAAAPAANPRRRRRRRRKNPTKAHRAARRTAQVQAKAMHHAYRRKAAKKAARTRRRHGRLTAEQRRARRRSYYLRRTKGKTRRYGIKKAKSVRRWLRRKHYGRQGAYVRKYKMHSNPRRRRYHRRNPGRGLIAGTPGVLMNAVKSAVPIAASLYLTRILINKLGPRVPGLDKLGRAAKPAMAALVVVGANYATKKGPLAKWRNGILIGTSLNLVDSLVSAFAPDSVKSMFGLGDSGMYDQAMGEFVTVNDYLEVGEPIDDDIALSDYVETSGIEEELGAIQEELGVEEELGALEGGAGPRRLGGVSQSSMLKALKQSSAIGTVPTRSFTKRIPHAGQGYDNPATLYTGIFGGGF